MGDRRKQAPRVQFDGRVPHLLWRTRTWATRPALRQSVYGHLAGYEGVNDAERLCIDPAIRRVVGGRAKESQTAFTSEMNQLETEMLSSMQNLGALMNLPGTWIDLVQECAPLDKLILDLDSSQSETYGDQQGSPYNGYFECTCYHPLFLFYQHGDLERAMLQRGNHNSAKFCRRVLLPGIERYRDRDVPKYFRTDAATEGKVGDSNRSKG